MTALLLLPAWLLAHWQAALASPGTRNTIGLLVQALPPLLAYCILVRGIERRPLYELSVRGLPLGLLGGAIAGLALFSAAIGLMAAAGGYHVLGINPVVDWSEGALVVGLGAAVAEEILFRGGLYRLLEEGLGTHAALLGSALVFGLMHLGNAHASLAAGLAIAIEAGLLFGLLFHLTRSLWPCIGLHAAWNFSQGTLYGVPVSGLQSRGLLHAARSGPDWLTGGAFGAEASLPAVIVCVSASLVLYVIARRRGTLLAPSWRR